MKMINMSCVLSRSYAVKRSFILKIVSILISSTITLLVSFVFIQIFYRPARVYSGWRSFAPVDELNELGFRGQNIRYSPEDYVIVLLGDSQVESITGCKREEMPEKRLEFHLNSLIEKSIKVFSLGASGYGQDQEYLALQQYYSYYRADLVILWFTPGNDVWNNVFPTNWPKNGPPKPTFFLKEGRLVGPTEQLGQEIGYSPVKVFMIMKHLMMDRDAQWEKILPPPYKPVAKPDGPVLYDWQERWNNNVGFMRYENLETEKCHMAISFYPPSERMMYGIELSKQLLKKIEKLVMKNKGKFQIFEVDGIRPVINTKIEPAHANMMPQDKRQRTQSEYEYHYLNGNIYCTSTKQFRNNIRSILSNFQFYDAPPTVMNWRVSKEDGHLNKDATDQVMRDLSLLLKQKVLER